MASDARYKKNTNSIIISSWILDTIWIHHRLSQDYLKLKRQSLPRIFWLQIKRFQLIRLNSNFQSTSKNLHNVCTCVLKQIISTSLKILWKLETNIKQSENTKTSAQAKCHQLSILLASFNFFDSHVFKFTHLYIFVLICPHLWGMNCKNCKDGKISKIVKTNVKKIFFKWSYSARKPMKMFWAANYNS